MLEIMKAALWLSTDAFDAEIERLISAAIADLGIAGIKADISDTDPNIIQAIATYCRLNFGSPADYERLKKSYDEQKAQLQSASGYGLPNDQSNND